jgi:hypothetical protein
MSEIYLISDIPIDIDCKLGKVNGQKTDVYKEKLQRVD